MDLHALAAAVLGSVWVAVHAGAALDDVHNLPANPFDLLGGDLAWPPSATWVLAVVLLLGAGAATLVQRQRGRVARVDRAAAHMGRGREVRVLCAGHPRSGLPAVGPDPRHQGDVLMSDLGERDEGPSRR